jgi:hypothetical protein
LLVVPNGPGTIADLRDEPMAAVVCRHRTRCRLQGRYGIEPQRFRQAGKFLLASPTDPISSTNFCA